MWYCRHWTLTRDTTWRHSPSVGCVPGALAASSEAEELVILMQSTQPLLLWLVLLLSHWRNPWLIQGTQTCFPIRVLFLVLHFEIWCEVDFPSFACGIQLFQHHLLKRRFFPFILVSTLCNTMHISMMQFYFWALVLLHDHPYASTHCLGDGSKLWSQKCESKLVPTFQDKFWVNRVLPISICILG